VKEQLERLIEEMVDRGIRYSDAQREFERRFIARVLARADFNLGRAADALGMHRNTLSRKIASHRLRRSTG
jgi:Fis family transcriptional regulator, factor for inversion stimulation protein